MKDGIINVYKEAGWTSSDVVVKLRHILKSKKIGHTGTLDPAAEGVLPICVGRATQLSDYIMDKTKTYEAELILGTITDTQDITGNVLENRSADVSIDQLRETVKKYFVGQIGQIPPMYSAIKHNGKKLYELARKGVTVERKERMVNIYSVDILEQITSSRFLVRVVCSKGTYIRTLCADIGEKLGCGGCMGKLLRTACDNYILDKAYRIDDISEMMQNGDTSFVTSMEEAMFKFEKVNLKKEFAFHFLNGLDASNGRYSCDCDIKQDDLVRVYVQERFCAIGQLTSNGLHLKNLLVDVGEFLGGID